MPINYLKKIQLGNFDATGYRIEPSSELASIIEGFYMFSGASKGDVQLVFNDGFPVLVFLNNHNDTVDVIGDNLALEIKSAWASAGTIKNVYIKYNHHSEDIFVVRFHPGAFYNLFGLDAPYFRNRPLAPFGPIAKDHGFNMEEFFRSGSAEEKKAFVEVYIQQLARENSHLKVLQRSLDYIHSTKGQSTVRKVSADAGVNYKWLERSFLKNIGLLPKEYIQLQRFITAYLDLVGTNDVDLMRIAVSNGYYDANHFLKDFKVYTGKTPLEYLRFSTARL